jgi:hypothetical protein
MFVNRKTPFPNAAAARQENPQLVLFFLLVVVVHLRMIGGLLRFW